MPNNNSQTYVTCVFRSAKDDQFTEFQNRLMEESQKSKAYGFGYLVLLVTLILAYQFGVLASTSWI